MSANAPNATTTATASPQPSFLEDGDDGEDGDDKPDVEDGADEGVVVMFGVCIVVMFGDVQSIIMAFSAVCPQFEMLSW